MENIESKAFREAALKSESYRILGLLALLFVLLVFTGARAAIGGVSRFLAAQALLVVLAVGYEIFMLHSVRKEMNGALQITPMVWFLNILIETQIPTLALIVLIRNQVMPPFEVLVAPAVLLYFFFIILSTLRLTPVLSILTGLMSALGYIAVVGFTISTIENAPSSPTFSVYFIYAALIFASGLAAAFVAGQIRSHVVAALREAELQRELDRVNHDLDTARSIQQGLLPTEAPDLAGFEIAGWNQPADETGGDYFDWQELPDGRIAISLADAAGHGIGPALVSTSCRAYARASLSTNGAEDGVLSRLNGLLKEDLPANKFVTFVVIFLDPSNAKVEVLSAGHGPILWYRCGANRVDTLEAQGIPLGLIGGVEYGHATEGVLGEGDALALITDGFFEWEDPEGEQFGTERLEKVLMETRGLPAKKVIERLRAAVEEFCRGTAQNDDLTAVILRRKDAGHLPVSFGN